MPFKAKHLPALLEMLKSQDYQGLTDIEMKTLPKCGYIAFLKNQPIAAGFLRRVEPSFAQLDTFATNAYFGSIIRHKGLVLVVDALLADAKQMKLTGVLAFTGDEGIEKRAKDIGFHVVDQVILGRKI